MTDPVRPNSPPTKTVSFASSPHTSTFSSTDQPSTSSSSSSSTSTLLNGSGNSSTDLPSTSPTLPTTATAGGVSTRPSGPKRRRSSIKQGLQMPYKPPQEFYTHSDPLLRRLRLRNGFGSRVSLEKEFGRDAKVVLFFFGASWRGSSKEPFELVSNFQRRFPHQSKVIYVSTDETKSAYDLNTKGKNYLAMEWNDGSNSGSPESTEEEEEDTTRTGGSSPPLEPFLLAGDPDLEEETSLDPHTPNSLYLRPYSRVHLADKWQILGVPNLVVYHLESRKILSYHARFELLKGDQKMEQTWSKWSKGEKVTFGVLDFFYALRWTITFGLISLIYLWAVHLGLCPNYVALWSSSLSQSFSGNKVLDGGKIEL
ncbi:hypothetical protein JCM3765_003913 [Sporobolomyces pararoseus]